MKLTYVYIIRRLADIRFAYVIKALCFYYYCLCLPFVWLGKKIWWAVFKDTAAKKEAAQKAVLNAAKKKGKLEKYGMIDIAAELKNIEAERDKLRGEPEKNIVRQQSTSGGDLKTEQNSACTGGKGSDFENKTNTETKSKPKKNEKKQKLENDTFPGIKEPKAKSAASDDGKKVIGRQGKEQLPVNDVDRELNVTEKGMRSKKPQCEREQGKLEMSSKGDEVGLGLNKQKPGREDKRPVRRSRVEDEMRSSEKKSARRDPKANRQGCERMPGVSARSTKTKALKSSGGKRLSESKSAAHGSGHNREKKHSSASKDSSPSPNPSKTSHVSKTSDRQLSDTHSKNETESDCGEKQSRHASPTSSNKPDRQTEHSISVKSISSQHSSHKDGSNSQDSIAKTKSDSSNKNSDHQSNASLASSPTHNQPSGVAHSTVSHHSGVDKSTSSHHSVAKSTSSRHPAEDASQHSGMVSPHHSDADKSTFSHHSQTGGILTNSSHSQARNSESSVNSASHQITQSGMPRDLLNQSAVQSVSRELVTMHSSHHSHHSNDQPSAHSLHQFGSHDEKISSGSSSSMEKRSSEYVTTTSSSMSNSHRDQSLGGTSSSSDSHQKSTDSVKSSSTSTGYFKSSSTTSTSSSSSSEKTAETSSSSSEHGDSRTCDGYKIISELSNLQRPGSYISGTASSQHSSESHHGVDSTDDTNFELNKSSSSQHSEIKSEVSSLKDSEEEVDAESSYSSSNEQGEHSSEHTSSSTQESSSEESDHETGSPMASHHSTVYSTSFSTENESHSSTSSESESTSHHTLSCSPSSSQS